MFNEPKKNFKKLYRNKNQTFFKPWSTGFQPSNTKKKHINLNPPTIIVQRCNLHYKLNPELSIYDSPYQFYDSVLCSHAKRKKLRKKSLNRNWPDK